MISPISLFCFLLPLSENNSFFNQKRKVGSAVSSSDTNSYFLLGDAFWFPHNDADVDVVGITKVHRFSSLLQDTFVTYQNG